VRPGLLLPCIVAILAIAQSIAGAAEFDVRVGDGGEVVLRLGGTISALDSETFLREVNRHAPRVVEIEGPGGDFLSAVQIGVIIKSQGLRTHAIGECLSSCSYIWMAGAPMIADEGVTIGIHLPFADSAVPYAGPKWLPYALHGWYLGRLGMSVEMMEAFYIEATDYGRVPNRSFDMLEFARHWYEPVEIVPPQDSKVPFAER
jgi:hypothetical protein